MAARVPLSAIELGCVECGNGSRADSHGYLIAGEVDITLDGEGAADLAEDIFRAVSVHNDMLAALKAVNKIVSEAAQTGFNYADGDWPERLFHSQQATSSAIRKAEGR